MTGNLTIHFFICHLFRNLLFFLTHQLEKEQKHNENLDSLKLLWYNKKYVVQLRVHHKFI